MSKEKNLIELRDERKQLMDKRRALIEVAKKEERKLTADEQKEADRLEMDCKDLDLQIEEQRAMNRQNGTKHTSDDRPFSLRKAIVARDRKSVG